MGKDADHNVSERLKPAPADGSQRSADTEAGAPPGPAVTAEERRGPQDGAIRIASFVGALFLFILAIQLMKEGAGAIGPRLTASGVFDNAIQTLGLGWLGAYLVLSGSPIAATALAFHQADAITELQTFTMLSGSRLGASFIVLLVGFIYALRSSNRRESLGMGVLALSMTAVVYVPGMLLGYGILRSGLLDGVRWTASSDVQGVIDVGWGWIQDAFTTALPAPLLFPAGLGILLISFKLLDRVLPSLDGERQADGRAHWLKKPWPMFLLGCLAALLTLSVSVALTALVPLASKGYIKRGEAIPYIAGANVTTLADTLVAAMLLGKATGVQVVLAEAIAVALLTVVILAFAYRWLQRGVLTLDEWVVGTNVRLWLFVGVLFLVPLGLLVVGGLIGPVGR
jgi:solute carrier family 34 (sodium-dependent phosphate cotransporter)